jgi:phage-related tail fiber protein
MNNVITGAPSKSLTYLGKIMLANEMLSESVEKQNAYRAFTGLNKRIAKKSANPKKKAKRKVKQSSQRKNRK